MEDSDAESFRLVSQEADFSGGQCYRVPANRCAEQLQYVGLCAAVFGSGDYIENPL